MVWKWRDKKAAGVFDSTNHNVETREKERWLLEKTGNGGITYRIVQSVDFPGEHKWSDLEVSAELIASLAGG